jgi:rubredoxin
MRSLSANVWVRKPDVFTKMKCSRCGRFVAMDGNVKILFAPDTHFSSEKTELVCADCQAKERAEKQGRGS